MAHARRVAWVALVGGVLGAGLLAAPASATNNTGTVDTGQTSVYTDPDGRGGDECQAGKCERVNWCDGKGKNPGPLTDDAPLVDKGKGGEPKPECIKRPVVEYRCCVADQNGTANVDVVVTNHAKRGYTFRAQLGDGRPVVKWVAAGATVHFRFTDVANGQYRLRVSVKTQDKAWCLFKVETITV